MSYYIGHRAQTIREWTRPFVGLALGYGPPVKSVSILMYGHDSVWIVDMGEARFS